MSLEVFVMPLWKFKAGDFASSVEVALGIRPKVATAEGIFERVRSNSAWARWRARRQARAIARAASRLNGGVPVEWPDEGGVVEQGHWRDFASIKAYAWWLDCRDRVPEFPVAPDGNDFANPVFEHDVDRPSFPHLVGHDLHNGYYLPCEFDRVAEVEPFKAYGVMETTKSVGSTTRLLGELDRIQQTLRVPDGYEYDELDPLAAVKADYRMLRKLAEASQQHRLPIIFWG